MTRRSASAALLAVAAMIDGKPMLDHATASRVIRIVAAELGLANPIDAQPVKLNSRLVDDLNIDSLTRVVIAAELEDHFDVAISDDAVAKANTVSDLVGLVAVRLVRAGR